MAETKIGTIFKVVFKTILGAFITISLYFLITGVYWRYYPYQTSDVVVPIEILNEGNRVAPGENIRMLLIVDKQTNISPDVSRNVLCSDGTLYGVDPPAFSTNLPIGKFVVERQFKLTEEARPGQVCTFYFNNIYQVNPIRQIIKVWYSEPFTVE